MPFLTGDEPNSITVVEAATPVISISDGAPVLALDEDSIVGPAGPPATPITRTTATYTTGSLADGASEVGTIIIALGYRLMHIQTSVASRVELYTTVAAQVSDASRAIGVDPAVGLGLVLDYVTTPSLLTDDLSPFVDGASMETVPGTAIPLTVTNLSGGTNVVVVTLTYIKTE